MVNYAARALKTPQTQPLPGRAHEMEQNAAGGYGFKLDAMQRLRRFLILGAAGGTYYVGEGEHIKENHATILEALKTYGEEVVMEIVAISDAGRAPNNKPALFALACAAAYGVPSTGQPNDEKIRSLALAALSKVARTGSDLMYFASQVNEMRGWGRALRRAVGAWFTSRNPDNLAYQVMKYRQREGWALSDLLRLSHPKTDEEERNAIFKWVVDNEITAGMPDRLNAAHDVITGHIPAEKLASIVKKFKLPREVLPTESLNRKDVWEALMEDMPGHAMLRNLGKMTSIDVLKPLNKQVGEVCATLADGEYLRKARMHPLQILLARHVYGLGHGIKGSLSWSPITQILEGLDAAFYSAFDEALMTKKSAVIAVDVSGSMGGGRCAGMEHMTAGEGAAMMALTLKRVIPNCQTVAFDTSLHPFTITGQPSFAQVRESLSRFGGGGTNCELAFDYAEKHSPDAVIVITDNETWAGNTHAVSTLEKMRRKNPDTKAVLVAMTASRTSIADKHPGNFETVGLDASLARIVTDFLENRV